MKLQIPEAFSGLFTPSRYKAYYGGRGSAKSHSFAAALIVKAMQGTVRVLGAREIQKSIKDSSKRLLEDKIRDAGALDRFQILDTEIRGPHGSLFTFAGLRTNPDALKSSEGLDIVWVAEANQVSQRSLDLLIPTVRKPGSELWFDWNPENDYDPVDRMFRSGEPPPRSIVQRVSWRDNPWFPDELREEMDHLKRTDPEKAEWIWEGEYVKAVDGAYYAAQIAQARREGRIGFVAEDPTLQKRAYWDIGTSDATAIWIAQFVGLELRVLDYCEAEGQPLGYYADWLRRSGHGSAVCVLPHDGARRDAVSAVRFDNHLKQAGFEARVVGNQGKGAAMQRIEAARRLFPRLRFDAEKCAGGLKALAAYHEKRDPDRMIGLGPEHDWASHAADAFGLMCVDYKEPRAAPRGPMVAADLDYLERTW